MYVSVYKHTKKSTGEWNWITYKTKSLTAYHRFLAEQHNATTYKDPDVVLTHVVGGMFPLPKPIVQGEKVEWD